MRRRVVAALWVAAATGPLLLATVFVFGCCVLPFHQLAHKLMPICDMAASMMRGDRAEHQHDATPAPEREKQEPVKRIATEVPRVFRLAVTPAAGLTATPDAATAYRSFITLGAVRCDRDVGWHVLVATFLI